ncbi:MAG: efflux RND transporter permease subunit [Rhodomicrobium sp.]
MSISAPFIKRPVATTLITAGIALAGALAFPKLPVASLPEVDFPTIFVQAQLPGANPETVATSVASPLERHLGTIADVTEMTSSSALGATRITLQFGLDRDINGAARDVQAGINAAHADLPFALKQNPTYRKVNPADAPILILAMTSQTLTRGQLYEAATNVLQQRVSQLRGVGQVIIGGAALPAVRVELNPNALFKYGIGLEDVRAALASANANSPKGAIEDGGKHFQLYTNDQANRAADYKPLVIAYRNNAPVRLTDVADVEDSVEDLRNVGLANGKPSVLVIIFREPGANIISTVERVNAELPRLKEAMPTDIDIHLAADRTTTIRASLRDTELTLAIAMGLVTLIVFLFLRDVRATIVPAIAVPVSIMGTFAAMYLLNFSLDNLSLMALTISTGFVVDDAIVVVENISRHIEEGMTHREAALRGAAEIGFTVLSISISLIAVFIPILFMSGFLGRLFQEFALTLSLAILISLFVSLTATPMISSLFLREPPQGEARRRSLFNRVLGAYEQSLGWALGHRRLVLFVLIAAVGLNIILFIRIPKGFFPEQDTGRVIGSIQADQSISFQLMEKKLAQLMSIVQSDPGVDNVVGFTGGGGGGNSQTNTGTIYIALKPVSQRQGMNKVIARIRRRALAEVPGARLLFFPIQDIRIGARSSAAQYQYTLRADNTQQLYEWSKKLLEALQQSPMLTDVNTDQQQKGLSSYVVIDHDTTSRVNLTPSQIDNTLYDAFGQRQVSVIYTDVNQYHVVMEVAPKYWQSPESLRKIYVSTYGGNPSGTSTSNAPSGTVSQSNPQVTAVLNSLTPQINSNFFSTSQSATTSTSTAAQAAASSQLNNSARNSSTNALASTSLSGTSAGASVSIAAETMVPLKVMAKYTETTTPIVINHQGLLVAATISFNLKPGVSLGAAVAEIKKASDSLHIPPAIHGSLQGTAREFEKSLASEEQLVIAALIAVYLVLGVLYESYIHPVTILSTLPSAGIGAVLALFMFNIEFSIITLIGVILLIGIVKKNAILMIDFAIDATRHEGVSSRDAIFRACVLRFRPIMMTTMAAIFGAVPLALSFGEGGELRRPLGIAIVGGLIISQLMTLYTTPVVYLYLDDLRAWLTRRLGTTGLAGDVPHLQE